MSLLKLLNRRSQTAGHDGEVGKLDYRIGNPRVGQGVFLTGTTDYLPVEGKVSSFERVLDTSTTAYTAGDAVGSMFAIPNMARYPGGGGTVNTVVLKEDTTQAISGTLYLFKENFAGTADNAAFAPTDAQMRFCVGTIPITSYSTTAPSSNRVATARALGLTYQCGEGDTALYAQFQTDGTPTYAASGVQLTIASVLE